MRAPINKIIKFSNVDGPSNRCSIFFQKCPNNCLFCHNPETINMCINCGECVEGCPSNALTINSDNKVIFNPDKCIDCDQCIKVCRFNASPKIRYLTVDELFAEIDKIKLLIDGITVSGGECMEYPDFLTELFKKVKEINLTTFIDSSGYYDFSKYPELLKYTDKVMLDVKAYDSNFYKLLVKSNVDTVLKNLKFLLDNDKMYEVRTIIFPNEDIINSETVSKVSKIINGRCYYKLIKYRPIGVRQEGKDQLGNIATGNIDKYVDIAKKNNCKVIEI